MPQSRSQKDPQLHYRRQGRGPALVLVHGFFGAAAVWEHQLQTLSEHFDVIAPEHAGYGDSAERPARARIADFGADIFALLDALQIDRFYLLGHSMGGMIAQQMAADQPQRVARLVCYGTGPRGNMPNRFETLEQSRQRILRDGSAATGRQIAAKWFMGAETAAAYPMAANIAAKMQTDNALAGLEAMGLWDGCGQLAAITSPTLVIWGDGDRSYPWSEPKTLWRGIAACRLAVMPNCGHNAHLENPVVFNQLVLDFLAIKAPPERSQELKPS